MLRLIALLALLALATGLAAPSHAQQAPPGGTRIEKLASGSVVVVFPDRTRVVLDREVAEQFTRDFYDAVGAGATTDGSAPTDGGEGQQTLVETEAVSAVVGLESDTSQFGVQEALNLEIQVNRAIADETARGALGDGVQDDGGTQAGADGAGAFNPVVDLTDPSANGDENIPASGAQ